MGWYSKVHFKGEVAVAGFPTHIELTSDYGVIYNEKTRSDFEHWGYHLTFHNIKLEEYDVLWEEGKMTRDEIHSITDNPDKFNHKVQPEFTLPYISQTGYHSHFFNYHIRPFKISKEETAELIKGVITAKLGRNVELLSKDTKPVEILSELPDKPYEKKEMSNG